MACASCVKQVTPLGPGRLIVNSSPSDTIVRNDSGAVTRDTSLGFQLNSMASVQTDGFFLPLASSDGMRLAWQQQSNFNWPLLLALPEASLAAHGVVAVRALDELEPAHTWNGAFMLGRSCNSDGVLVESPQSDGTRWIGVLPWEGGDARWLVRDSNVNAFASIGPRGELAWSHREIGEMEFSLTVERPEGKFEWPRKNNESWLLPIVATDGIFAAHLRDELGQFPHTKARPVQASIASALSFTLGGLIPFAGALAPTVGTKVMSIIVFTLLGLIGTGVLSARIAGSPYLKTTIRILIGGSLGMAITAGIGSLVHISGI